MIDLASVPEEELFAEFGRRMSVDVPMFIRFMMSYQLFMMNMAQQASPPKTKSVYNPSGLSLVKDIEKE